MARITKPLTNTEVERSKPKDKPYTLADGGGLYLLINQNGKYWRFNYYHPITKKRILLSLGAYPSVTLLQARQTRERYKALIAQGVDPQTDRQQQQETQQREHSTTFRAVMLDWYEWRKARANFNPEYARQVQNLINRNLMPYFADLPITSITAPLAIKTLKPLQDQGKLLTLKKVIQILNFIMTYAHHREMIPYNPCVNITKEFDTPRTTHNKTIHPDQLADFIHTVKTSKCTARTVFLIFWQLLTMARPSEARKAKWADIDEKSGIWTYYIQKGIKETEQGRVHKVTLSTQALALLQQIKTIAQPNSEYLFSYSRHRPTPPNRAILNNVFDRLGFKGKLSPHGLRSIASTYLNELDRNNKELVEIALSHIDKDRIHLAYNRAEYLEERRKLLQQWGDYCEQCGLHSLFDLNQKRYANRGRSNP